jgi:hypothetical protein
MNKPEDYLTLKEAVELLKMEQGSPKGQKKALKAWGIEAHYKACWGQAPRYLKQDLLRKFNEPLRIHRAAIVPTNRRKAR